MNPSAVDQLMLDGLFNWGDNLLWETKVNKAIDMGFDKGLVSRKIDVWLNGQPLFDPVFKCYLNDLKINLPNKSY